MEWLKKRSTSQKMLVLMTTLVVCMVVIILVAQSIHNDNTESYQDKVKNEEVIIDEKLTLKSGYGINLTDEEGWMYIEGDLVNTSASPVAPTDLKVSFDLLEENGEKVGACFMVNPEEIPVGGVWHMTWNVFSRCISDADNGEDVNISYAKYNKVEYDQAENYKVMYDAYSRYH